MRLIGTFNGLLVTRTGTPSLIITLGTLMIFRGLAIALTEGFSFSVPYDERERLHLCHARRHRHLGSSIPLSSG